ncbi:hypothetical protein D9M72_549240 [compost metagenome]
MAEQDASGLPLPVNADKGGALGGHKRASQEFRADIRIIWSYGSLKHVRAAPRGATRVYATKEKIFRLSRRARLVPEVATWPLPAVLPQQPAIR